MSEPGVAEGELVADVAELCRRLVGQGEPAREAAVAALRGAPDDRLEVLSRAVQECRRRTVGAPPCAPARAAERAGGEEVSLDQAVAAEIETASNSLPDRQREALVLRERLGLSHAQMGQTLGLDEAAVGLVLARARLLLRARLRGTGPEMGAGCTDWEDSLRALARRQDGEPMEGESGEWLREHLMSCPECERAHAAMLEASVCYRAWRSR